MLGFRNRYKLHSEKLERELFELRMEVRSYRLKGLQQEKYDKLEQLVAIWKKPGRLYEIENAVSAYLAISARYDKADNDRCTASY